MALVANAARHSDISDLRDVLIDLAVGTLPAITKVNEYDTGKFPLLSTQLVEQYQR
ncbi:MAG: hypothetical protein VYC39_05595 [Myxococcota bacterium]|nr:hypothetical protein [Myxococcota bacterium]